VPLCEGHREALSVLDLLIINTIQPNGTLVNADWALTDVGTFFVQAFDMPLAQWVGAKAVSINSMHPVRDSNTILPTLSHIWMR
jgi:hypothetical protein